MKGHSASMLRAVRPPRMVPCWWVHVLTHLPIQRIHYAGGETLCKLWTLGSSMDISVPLSSGLLMGNRESIENLYTFPSSLL